MYKELIISIIVITLIIIGNIVTQSNTIKSIEEINNYLIPIRDEISKQDANQEEARKKMEEVDKIWKEKYEEMAYYIEHDELEKVETELTKLKADIDMEEYAVGVENLDNCIFILRHIKDKSALKIVNVF